MTAEEMHPQIRSILGAITLNPSDVNVSTMIPVFSL
jgi:hypothetical protein